MSPIIGLKAAGAVGSGGAGQRRQSQRILQRAVREATGPASPETETPVTAPLDSVVATRIKRESEGEDTAPDEEITSRFFKRQATETLMKPKQQGKSPNHIEIKIEEEGKVDAGYGVGLEGLVKKEENKGALNPYVEPFDREEFFKKYTEDAPGPKGWREIYAMVKEMRSQIIAPVDTMGCERIPEKIRITDDQQDSSEGVSPEVYRFQLLVALLLSSQTKDQVTSAAVEALRGGLHGKGLNVAAVRATPEPEIDALIQKVGFHRRKAGYLKRVADILHAQYDDDIPPSLEEIVALPGIGPKMGHLLVQRAWGKVEGIGVDVHVHRLSNQWGWSRSKTKREQEDPQVTRVRLEEWLPRDLWVDINPALVGFGQTVCPARGPKCGECLISGSGLCPVSKKRKKQ